MGMWEHVKLGERPQHIGLRFFCCGRSLKIHIGIERELVVYDAAHYTLWSLLGTLHTLDPVMHICVLLYVLPKMCINRTQSV
jgi:hypothetical protein